MTGNERRVLKPGWESTRSRHEKGTRGTLPKVSTPRAHVTYIAQWEKNQNSRDHGRGSWRPSLLVLRILQITPSLAPIPLRPWLSTGTASFTPHFLTGASECFPLLESRLKS